MKFILGLVLVFWLWFVPAMLAAAVVALLIAISGGRWPWFVWVLATPYLYSLWLVAFLFFCGLGMRRMGRRHPKPRRSAAGDRGLFTIIACNYRLRIIDSLPLAGWMRNFPPMRDLVMRAYAPSVHVGKGAQVAGLLWDPDLIELGDQAIIGAQAAVSAHLLTTLPTGKQLYFTSVVKIGSRASIGAGAIVSMGCTIGEDAVLEPLSFLPPFTEIPAGEVWGDRPARFQRKRAEGRSRPVVETGSP
jgi:hypothetical protein